LLSGIDAFPVGFWILAHLKVERIYYRIGASGMVLEYQDYQAIKFIGKSTKRL
jgi:hypothetical protein